MTTFSAMWTDKLGAAIKDAAEQAVGYPIECHEGSEDFQAISAAVNQGIDSRLEAIAFSEFDGAYSKRGFRFTAGTLPVLVRRLMEDGDDNAQALASGICETLGIELI